MLLHVHANVWVCRALVLLLLWWRNNLGVVLLLERHHTPASVVLLKGALKGSLGAEGRHAKRIASDIPFHAVVFIVRRSKGRLLNLAICMLLLRRGYIHWARVDRGCRVCHETFPILIATRC